MMAGAQGGASSSMIVRPADNGWIIEFHSFNAQGGQSNCVVCLDAEQLKIRLLAWVAAQAKGENTSSLRSVT